jgi:hypothetical protein
LSTPKVEDKKTEKLLSSTTGALTEHFQKFKNSKILLMVAHLHKIKQPFSFPKPTKSISSKSSSPSRRWPMHTSKRIKGHSTSSKPSDNEQKYELVNKNQIIQCPVAAGPFDI